MNEKENRNYVTFQEHIEEVRVNDPEYYQMYLEKVEEKLAKIKKGGFRAGSGRKKIAAKKITVSVVLSPETIKKIDRERGSISRSKYVNEILEKYQES